MDKRLEQFYDETAKEISKVFKWKQSEIKILNIEVNAEDETVGMLTYYENIFLIKRSGEASSVGWVLIQYLGD